MSRILVGTSGWRYDEWRGRFYPAGLPRTHELRHATAQFDTIEINASFYSLLTPRTWARHAEQAPAGFVYAVKGGRFITHSKKLKDVETALANFFASGILRLEDKLGPILWQLAGGWRIDVGRIAEFLRLVPRDTSQAARLARQHDHRVPDAWIETGRNRPLRHALEIRHPSAFTPELVRAARRTNTALVASDAIDWPYTEELTAGFVYVRLHGPGAKYASRYDDAALDRWAARIRAWHAGGEPPDARRITDLRPPARKARDVYVYFDNDRKAYAPDDARRLMQRLGLQREERL